MSAASCVKDASVTVRVYVSHTPCPTLPLRIVSGALATARISLSCTERPRTPSLCMRPLTSVASSPTNLLASAVVLNRTPHVICAGAPRTPC
jgi:hypothetical protein